MDKEQQFKKECDKLSNKLLSKNAVCQLSGNEFAKKEGVSLQRQVVDYFNSLGGIAVTVFGEVYLDSKGVKNDIYHGLTREKA